MSNFAFSFDTKLGGSVVVKNSSFQTGLNTPN